MNIYKQFETNKEAENKGIWVEYGEGVAFKIARMAKSNKQYTKAMEVATRPHRRAMELETMDAKLAESIFMSVFVDTILLDWKGVTDRDGNELKFNKENATQVFTDLPELYDDLAERAKKATLYREHQQEEEAKN